MYALTEWFKLHAVGLGFCLLLGGCQFVFGDFELKPTRSEVGGQGSTSAGGTTSTSVSEGACSSEGSYRCNGANLEICQGSKWQTKLPCPTAAQCDKDHARCRTCAPGTTRCSAFRLERCQDSGESWSLVEACLAADRCDSVNGTCATCKVDEAFCSGPRLNVCNSARAGWDVTVCDNANLCSTSSRSCRRCVAGEYQCNQNSLQRCSDGLEWVTVEECASNVLCASSLITQSTLAARNEGWNGKCDLPLCSSGAYRCDPTNLAQLQTCPPGRDHWESVGSACYTAALCDATAGKCADGCVPGTYQCNGAQLLHCIADGTMYEQVQICPTAAQCSTAKQTCMPCVVGDLQCNGAQLQQCNASQAWVNLGACATSELCALSAKSKSTTCTPPGCIPPAGTERCDGPNKATLQVCPPSLVNWVDKEVCATPGLCDTGKTACIPPVCDYAGQTRCTGQKHENCDASRKTWSTDATCTSSQICDVAKGCLGQCPAVAQRCNGRQIEICSVNTTTQAPAWTNGDACASAALCSVNATTGIARCILPACLVPGYSCVGQQLHLCSVGLDADQVVTCSATQICDKAGGQCDNCIAGNFSCSGAIVQQCSADGQSLKNISTNCLSCGTSSDFKTGYCYVCNSADQQCSGSSIQSCATGRTAWNTATACTAGFGCQVVDGHKDFCAACPTANEVQCVAATPSTTIHTCAANRSAWSVATDCGAAGCFTNPTGNDYCANCTANQTQCVGTTDIHTCAANGTGFGTTTTCANGCMNVSGANSYCASCTANQVQCVGTTGIHTCTPDGRGFGTTTTCADGCVNVTGGNSYCASCPASQSQCVGATGIHTCAADGSGFGTTTTCANGCVSVTGGNSYCATCTANRVECAGTTGIHTCAADGSGFGTTTTCADGCVNVTGGNSYCAACIANRVECVGTTGTHTCAADGSGFGTTTTCPNGCVSVTSGSSYCATCVANRVECADPLNTHTCLPDGTGWGAPALCPNGCVNGAAGADAYCAPAPPADAGVTSGG